MVIPSERILMSILWIALMLIFLLGDVLRIFAGDFVPGQIDGQAASSKMWFGAAIMMVIPIIMVVLNILVPGTIMRWPNIVLSLGFFFINIVGIKGYKSYDQLLLVISFGINMIIVYYAIILYKA